MAKNKLNDKYSSESYKEIKSFIIILLVVIAIVIAVYFISVYVVNKRDDNTTSNNENYNATINYNILTVGMILNRPYSNYYVIVYDSTDSEAIHYSAIINNYQANKDSKKIYYCDLDNELNKSYISESDKGNKNAKKTDDFKFGKLTLLEIKNGKVIDYVENLDKIKNILK